MKEFSFSTRVYFGEGALDRLSKVENRRVFVVTDRFMVESGILDKVLSYLVNCEVTVFSKVEPDPTIDIVAAGVSSFLNSSAEVMIALGGGSSIDAAKAIRAVATRTSGTGADVMECFAIPTTSGTGSEVTEYAVITDAETETKYPLTNRAFRPPVAILDPSLVVTAPPSVTAASGMDVLTHALEAYVSLQANDFSDALAEKTVSLVFKWLPKAYQNGEDLLAREEMHNASCLAGLAFNSAGLGICHGLAHAIGGKLHIAHGKANAIILPHILRYNANLDSGKTGGEFTLAARKYQRLAKLLDMPANSVTVGVSQLINGIDRLNKAVNIPATLRAAGTDMAFYASLEDELIQAALADATTATNPRKATEKDVKKLLSAIGG